MIRIVRTGMLFMLATSLLVAAWSGWRIFRLSAQNRQIAALQAGTDSTVSMDAAPALLAARAHFAMSHGKTQAAQAIADRLGVLHATAAQADVLYALGNVNMRDAFTVFTQLPFRLVAPRIRLAKAQYRQAIALDPDNWDARYNFALAAALVRDTESSTPSAGDEMAHERAAWPDIPGAPNGMP